MKLQNEIILTPAQKRVVEELLKGMKAGDVLVLRGAAGMGRTAILERVHAVAGGVLVSMRDVMRPLAARRHAAVEEAFLRMLEQSLAAHNLVIVDDLHLVSEVSIGFDYPRAYLLDAALTAILGEASASKKKLLFGVDGDAPWPIRRRAHSFEIVPFGAEDYECMCGSAIAGK